MRFSAFLATCMLLCAATAARADLRVDQSTLDLGDIHGGMTLECAFKLKNAGRQTIELVDLERSCGCVEPHWSTRLLEPGTEATLSLRLRTLGQLEGPRVWPMVVVWREGGETRKTSLAIKGVVRNEIVLQPPTVALHVTKTLVQEITLMDRRARPLTVTAVDFKFPGVTVERIDSAPGTTRFKLTVDAAKLPAGRSDRVLHLFTNDARYDHLEVPIALTRMEKPRVTWSPETPEIVLAPGQQKASVLVRVAGSAETPLAVEKVESQDAGVTCASHAAMDSLFVRVTVERAAFVRQGLQTSVRLTGTGEPIAIPILVRIE